MLYAGSIMRTVKSARLTSTPKQRSADIRHRVVLATVTIAVESERRRVSTISLDRLLAPGIGLHKCTQ